MSNKYARKSGRNLFENMFLPTAFCRLVEPLYEVDKHSDIINQVIGNTYVFYISRSALNQ